VLDVGKILLNLVIPTIEADVLGRVCVQVLLIGTGWPIEPCKGQWGPKVDDTFDGACQVERVFVEWSRDRLRLWKMRRSW
jgi:hypothetical protein